MSLQQAGTKMEKDKEYTDEFRVKEDLRRVVEYLDEIEETLTTAEIFPMDPAESLTKHIEHIISYVHRLEEKLEDQATTMAMIRALVRDGVED